MKLSVELIITFHDLTYWPPLVWLCTEENTPISSMLPSLAFWYILLLFPPLIKRRLFYSEFLTQILYLSSLPLFSIYFTNPVVNLYSLTPVPICWSHLSSAPLFAIYFTNPCCQPLLPNLCSQLLLPTSLPYPCSQSILPTPVANLYSLTSVLNCCPLPLFPIPVPNLFYQSLLSTFVP